MFSKVKWRQWKKYSGPWIKGTSKFTLGPGADHWQRIVWLTAQVETGGTFGATMAYDGTGNTSGVIQGIAVYPRELAHEDNNPEDDQGPLWDMLEHIRYDNPELTKPLEDELFECGWALKGGRLRVINKDGSSGEIVNGRLIREELTPNQGVVPKSGNDWASAKSWALLFHEIFANPNSYDSQIRFGIEHAQKSTRRKPSVLRGKTISSLVYSNNPLDTKLLTPNNPVDLAMAVLFSNMVNAPAMAFRKLRQAFDTFAGGDERRPNWQSPKDQQRFAKKLIEALGKANYARWNFQITSGRYQRTRKAAMKIWPVEFFEGRGAIMPRRL